MAERLSQYPMMPNFNPALMQAQQQQTLQQQPQDGPHPPIQNFTVDNTRMWQQIQHMQQQHRQGSDINPQSAQMADLLRSHHLARVQGQQQQQLNQQQPFGGPSQQHQPGQPFHDPSSNQPPPQSQHPGFMNNVNGGGGGGGNPSLAARNANVLQAFQSGNPGHDMSRQLGIMLAQQQQNQQQNNVGFNLRQQQMHQSSSPETHNLFPPQGMDRRPSPAHPHSLPNNMPPGPSNPMSGQGQPPLPQPQQPPGQGPQQPRRMTMGELNDRANNLRATIVQQETLLSHLNNQQRATAASGNQTDPAVLNKMRQLMMDTKGKKENLHRVTVAMQANMGVMMSGPNAQQPGNSGGGGGGPGPQQQQLQPPWIPQQSGQSPSFENPNPNGNANGNGNSQMRGGGMTNAPPPNVQPSPSHMHAQAQQLAQAQANHLMGVGVPPRSGPTPHQQGPGSVPHGTPGGPSSGNTPFSTQMSPNMGPQLPFTGSSPPGMGGAGGGSGMVLNVGIPSQLPPPLEKARFENAYKSWVATKNMKHDIRLMNVEGRQIDLYALHMHVMQEGGASKVQNQELWAVIGARMGFVHFVASDAEPAKSGPGVAQRLAAVYKEYLMPFDLMYITSVNERRKQMQAAAAAVQAAANAGGGPGPGPGPGPSHSSLQSNSNANSNNSNMPPNSGNPTSNGNPNNPNPGSSSNPNKMSMNGNGNGNAMPMPPNPRGSMMDPRMMQQVIGFANKTVAELRQQNVSEQVIAFVETNRAQLQRTVMEQGMFRGQFQNQGQNQQQQPQQPLGAANGMRVGGEQGMGPGAGPGPGQGQGSGMFMASPGQGNTVLPSGNRPSPFLGQGISMQGGPSGTGAGAGFIDGRGQMMPQSNGPIQPLTRPTQNQMQQLMIFVEKTKANFKQIRLPAMQHHDIPQEQRAEYASLIEQLHHSTQEIDTKLPTYMFVLKSEEMIKRLIAIILTVAQQRAFFANGNMRYIQSLDSLRNMMTQVQAANEAFQAFLQRFLNISHSQAHQQLLPPQGHVTADMTRPPIPQPPPQIPQQSLHPTARPQLPQQQPNLRPPPQLMKMASSSSQNNQPLSVSTPTPPPSHPTPVANAPTPNPHPSSSPQAPKSPKGKTKAKAIQKRRVSAAATKSAHNATNANNAASNASTNANTPAPAPPPSEPPTPNGGGSGSSTKRQREEEESKSSTVSMLGESPAASGSGAVANEPSPPKRIKTEWEGPPSDALKKKTEAVENVKTEEDAAVFLEQMTELIKMAAGGEGQESLTSDISETLDMILKGYADGTDGTHGLPPLGMGNDGDVAQTSPANPPVDEFVEFFDFSSFGTLDDDDTGSKAPTPDLLSSSSTNPSPESNASESDAAHHGLFSATDPISIKMEDNGVMDLLRLGTLKEIDGGESAYFQPSEWKWDGSMPALEQQWAFSS